MEKLNQIIESGELRQALERHFSQVVIEALMEKLAEKKTRRCGHAAKLQAAEEMAIALRTIGDLPESLIGKSVKEYAINTYAAWENAGKEKGGMKTRLSSGQQQVIDLLKAGWELGHSTTIDGRWWLQKNGLGKGGEVIDVHVNIAYSLHLRGLIEEKKYAFPTSKWGLV